MANLTRALLGLWVVEQPPPPPLSRLLRTVEQTENGVRKLVKNHYEITLVIFWVRS